MSDTPGGIRHRAPMTGEHTTATLTDLGFTPQHIDRLRADGVIH
jgi:formyl-CoA transferase